MRRGRLAAVPALLLLAGGCTHVSSGAVPPALEGTAWVLADLPGHALMAGRIPTLQFHGGRAAGSDGCNRFTAPYTPDGKALAISPVATTRMACPEEVTRQADAYMAALTGARRHAVEDGRLQLQDADGKVLATLVKQAVELAGTNWRAVAINNGKQAVQSVAAGSTITLAFGTDGRAVGSAGCNDYTAGYTLEGRSLRFSPAAATRRTCAQADVMEQEQAFLAALESVATASIEGDALELRTAAGAIAASLVRLSGS